MQTQSLTVKNNGKASINLRSASGVNQILVDEIIKALKKDRRLRFGRNLYPGLFRHPNYHAQYQKDKACVGGIRVV